MDSSHVNTEELWKCWRHRGDGDAVSCVGLGTTLQWGGWKWRGGSQLQPPWENPGWELVSHLHEERASRAVLPAVLNWGSWPS